RMFPESDERSGEVDETLSGRGARAWQTACEDAGESLRHPEESGTLLCLALLLLTQQVRAGPLARSGPDRAQDRAQVQRRTARMSPLWRIMSSKPFGATARTATMLHGLCR
ncbi:unnamed protein product, partial [Tetraodon nigroviridis]